MSKSVEFKKLQSEVKKKEWDVNLIDFGGGGGADPEVNSLSLSPSFFKISNPSLSLFNTHTHTRIGGTSTSLTLGEWAELTQR